jgi:hypothetical protein
MFVVGALLLVSSAGAGTLLAWQNRAATVHVQVGEWAWNVRLYGVLIIGVLLACWFFLGAAFIQCRIAERRGKRAAHRTTATEEAKAPSRTRASVPPRAASAGLQR